MEFVKLAVAVVGGSAAIVLAAFGASTVQQHEAHATAPTSPVPAARTVTVTR